MVDESNKVEGLFRPLLPFGVGDRTKFLTAMNDSASQRSLGWEVDFMWRYSWLTLLLCMVLLPSFSNGQWIYAPYQVVPSPSVPVELWWDGRRTATLRVYRVKNFEEVLMGQKAVQELVWSKTFTRKPKEYKTLIKVPLLQVGVYKLEMIAGKVREDRTINVTRVLLVAKKSPTRVLVFTADAETGKPIGGCSVRLFDEKRKLIAQGKTDKKGLALVDYKLEDVTVIATAPDGSIATTEVWSETRERYTVYIYTDRPVYRPKQKVYFKGIVRKFEDGEYLTVADKQVRVVVRNPEDTEIARLTLTTNRYGSFAGEVDLPEATPLGQYGIIATIDGETHFAHFEVAKYRKPEFEVKVTVDKPYYIKGEQIHVSVKANYFFGAPVAEGKVTYIVSASPIWWSPFAEEFETWYETPPYYGEFIMRSTTKLGKDGTVKFTVPTAHKRSTNYDMRYFIRCEVTDQSNRTVSGSASCSVFRASFQIALATDRYAYRVGEIAKVKIKTGDFERRPVSVKLYLALESERWNRKAKRYERIEVERQQVTTDADGTANATFKLQKAGYYRIACWGRDERGNLTSGAVWVWVCAEGDFDYSYPTLELVCDKKTYRIGEVAKVLINSNRKGVWALVTVEGDDILEAFVIPLHHQSSIFELPITKKMRPVSYLRVGYVFEGRFISAHKSIVVPAREKFLRVEVTTEKPIYQPREKVRYRIVTRDAEGKPVSAELSFALVDEAIFAMRADRTPDIREYFFGWRPNLVETSWESVVVKRDIVVGKEKARYGLIPAGAFQKISEEEVRRRFEDTAFWHPFVVTDENGEATVEVPLPDNLTTWRATVRAITLQSQVGSTIQKIRVTKPILVRLQLPRFFTQHDVAKILTVVHNNTDEPQKVSVGLKAKGAIVSSSYVALRVMKYQHILRRFAARNVGGWNFANNSPTPNGLLHTLVFVTASKLALATQEAPEQTAVIPPHSTHTFTWWVYVPEASFRGKATFTAAVASESGLTDALELSVPVKPKGVEVVQSKSGITDTTATLTLRLPEDAILPASYLEIRLSPSLIGPMLGSLEYLVGYPYG
ncbi:MAG: hypothetical protein RUDDFDWM_000643 [Candidatus Fervidibacterota bacterium]